MIRDEKIMIAVSKILQRSERQVDDQKILDTFVDLGILSQLASRNNQIIYGRRGTGKTHVFRVLAARLEADSSENVVVYIDARTLGSSAQFGDPSVGMQRRVIALLRDIFGPVYNDLLEHIVEKGGSNAQRAMDALDTLLPAITESVKVQTEEKQTS
jgi:Cdc6-like AAA superfamily ATPase